jgi:hypothetical protein
MKIILDIKAKGRSGGSPRDPVMRVDRDAAFRKVREAVHNEFGNGKFVLSHMEEVKRTKLPDKSIEDALAVLANDFSVHFFWQREKPGSDPEGTAPVPAGWEVSGANLDLTYPSLSEAVEAAFRAIIDNHSKIATEHERTAAELRTKVRKANNIAETLGILQEDDDDDEELLDDDD